MCFLKSRPLCQIIIIFLISIFVSPVLAHISGAICTTVGDGSAVNANIYQEKEDVFLNGGPSSPNKKSMALPSGWYYFQVTDPSGKNLLSEDPVICRMFYVNDFGTIGGIDSSISCSHLLLPDITRPHLLANTLQLSPYKDTPNRGGVYKVWITPVEEFVGDVNANPVKNKSFVYGFVPAYSKTDNFKVKGKCDASTIQVLKFEDVNTNGLWDQDEPAIDDWQISITDPAGSSNSYQTPVNIFTSKGTWMIEEASDPNWIQTALFIDGQPKQPLSVSAPVYVQSDCYDSHQLIFGNTKIFDISVLKFHDKNMNGLFEDGEEWTADLPEITIHLTGSTLAGLDIDISKVVPVGGKVVFENLVSGNYTVCEEGAPSDWVAVTPECIEVALPADADFNQDVSLNFANVQKGSLSLIKFYDLDRDGYFVDGEQWSVDLPPITFCLSGSTLAGDLVSEQCKVIDANGLVVFNDLLPGQYTICEKDLPEGWQATTPECVDVSLASGQEVDLGHAVGNVNFCDVSVNMFYDSNENGQNDGEYPLDGVRFVIVDSEGMVVADKCTDSQGFVKFEKIYPGIYMLSEIMPVNDEILGVHWIQTTEPETIIFRLPDECDAIFQVGYVCREVLSSDFGTKGYWHNKNGLMELNSDQNMFASVLTYINSLVPYGSPSYYFEAGDEPFDGKFTDGSDVAQTNIDGALAGSVEAEIVHYLTENVSLGTIQKQLAQQLLAFIFNVHYKIRTVDTMISLDGQSYVKAGDLIAEAIDAWTSGNHDQQAAISTRLDTFNNSGQVLSITVFTEPCHLEPMCD